MTSIMLAQPCLSGTRGMMTRFTLLSVPSEVMRSVAALICDVAVHQWDWERGERDVETERDIQRAGRGDGERVCVCL